MTLCKQCSSSYSSIGQHWSKSSKCNFPDLTNYKKNILRGLLMGDGSICKQKKSWTPRMKCRMTNYEYLEYLDNTFDRLSNGVHKSKTGDQMKEQAQDRLFGDWSNASEFSDVYRWSTVTHPWMDELHSWYDSGVKVFPESISLNSTILKHWYVCDGSIGKSNNIRITICNEWENKDKIRSYFSDIGFEVSNWDDREINDRRYCSVCFTKEQSEKIFKYMGEPLPGFGYKWPNNNRKI